MPRAPLCSPCPIGRGPRTRAQSHKQQHKLTQPLDVVPHREVFLPKLFFLFFCGPTSQPSGLCGLCSARTVQPSRCCLSGPAASTPWWDKCAEEHWHRPTCLAVQSTNTPALFHMHFSIYLFFCSVSALNTEMESKTKLFIDRIVCSPYRILI